MISVKVCNKCKKELSINLFCINNATEDGLQLMCKSCNKQYRQDNRERISRSSKAYRKVHKERIVEYAKKYYKSNKGKVLEACKKYHDTHKGKIAKVCKLYRETHKEQRKQWNIDNPGKRRQYIHRCRAVKLSILCTFTPEEWVEVKKRFNNTCAYCGKDKPLEQDHVYPTSKEGEYTSGNIIPACKSCNSSKKNKLFRDWFPTFRYFSKKREGIIERYLEG